MPPRLRPLADPPILVAGPTAIADPTRTADERYHDALAQGATGLAGDLWVTGDGRPVVHPSGVVGGRLRRRRIGRTPLPELRDTGDGPLRLEALFDLAAVIVLDVREPDAVEPALDLARRHAAIDRLWLRHVDAEGLARWRDGSDAVRLVHVARLTALDVGPERHAARLREMRIDALQMPARDWSGGLTTLLHRFGRLAWATGADHLRVVRDVLDAGIDAVEGARIEHLVEAFRAVH